MTILRTIIANVHSLLRDRSGTSAVEYAMILGFIVMVMFVALSGLATEVTQLWNDIASKAAIATS